MARGLSAGALAGLWVAFADFGATWLWLPLPRDRFWLLVRLLACLVPVGGALGLLATALSGLCTRLVAGRPVTTARKIWPLPLVLLAAGPLAWLADKLCSGGMMSRLAARLPLEAALVLLLPLALYVALWTALRLSERARERRRGLHIATLLLLGSALLGKLNQTFLPNLYDYLHALLALLVWGSAALGIALLACHLPRLAAAQRRLDRPWVAALFGLVLSATAVANAVTLDHNLNVRVALFDARSPSSRALLASADPWLRKLEPPRSPSARRSLARAARPDAAAPEALGAHVLLVTIDALRADHLGLYGYTRPVSPELDAFAKQALVFERAYAQAPHSSYSLCSLHTSEYVHEVVELGRPLPTATLATALSEHGYHTAAFFTDGIFHTEGQKLRALRDAAFGFALFDHTNREAEQQTDRVLAEADRILQRGEPPSLLWVHYFDVHEPYQETTFGSGEMERYDSEILHVDRELARLVRELERRFERPLVVAVSADHGEEFRDHGGVYHGSTLFDEQVRVPLLIRVPGVASARLAAPVEVIDLAPTVLAAVGAPIPQSMRGRDLRAVVAGRAQPGAVFSAVLTKRMALSWPHKLIADLRFGLFELYDLERDPKERRNLAGEAPGRLTELRELVYTWLDTIDAQAERTPSAAATRERGLHLGRLGDRRAVEPMAALLLAADAPLEQRIEAGQILAKLADPSAVPALLAGLNTEPPEVAAEAAIALGRMYDDRARPALSRLMHVEDPHVRARAAVSLGRLRDRAAVPALIDALWVAPTQYEREEAVRWLGRLRAETAVEPLLSLLPEFGLRYLLAVALGQIGDTRAYDALVGMLEWESRTNIRDEVVRGLGLLGDPRAIAALLQVLEREPQLKNSSESLVRLGALERGALFGVDAAPRTKGLLGFARCEAGALDHDWDYAQRTYCISSSARAQVQLPLPAGRAPFDRGARLIVRARRSDAPDVLTCTLTLGAEPLGTLELHGEFEERRYELAPAQLQAAQRALTIACPLPGARFALDHALVLAPSSPNAGSGSERAKTAHDAQVLP